PSFKDADLSCVMLSLKKMGREIGAQKSIMTATPRPAKQVHAQNPNDQQNRPDAYCHGMFAEHLELFFYCPQGDPVLDVLNTRDLGSGRRTMQVLSNHLSNRRQKR